MKVYTLELVDTRSATAIAGVFSTSASAMRAGDADFGQKLWWRHSTIDAAWFGNSGDYREVVEIVREWEVES